MKDNTKIHKIKYQKKLDFGGPVSPLRKSEISDLESPSNFQVKEKKIFKSVHKQGNWTFVVQRVI